jgi:CRISPR-associated protein Cas1
VPTLYLTEDYSLVRREGEDMLVVQIPARKAREGSAAVPARSERIPLLKIDEVIVTGEVTLTASALHLLLERDIEITFLGRLRTIQGKALAALLEKRCVTPGPIPGAPGYGKAL